MNNCQLSDSAILPASAEPICDSDGELLPNPEDCRKYYKCAQGKPSDQSCPGSLQFDSSLKICNWPENVICAVSCEWCSMAFRL